MSGRVVEVRYKCACMVEETSLFVPARRSDEDIVFWMQSVVQPSIYLDHRGRAPECRLDQMEYAKLHLPENAEFIGAAPLSH